MIVLSGIPRGGTSVGMQIMIAALGVDRIIGEANPFEKRQAEKAKRDKNFRARLNDCQRYATDRQEADAKKDEEGQSRRERARRLNPLGFYESPFCVGGIRWLPGMVEELEEDLDAMVSTVNDEKVVKVVAQGLAMSDPHHVSKIVYMVRNPRAVAVSQEKLLRGDMFDESVAPKVDGKKALVRSVQMFNRATVAAALWIVKNNKPILMVEYNDLIDNLAKPLSERQEFIGEGDFLVEGAGAIRSELRRSKLATDTGPAWDFADAIFERLQVGDFAGIVELAEERKKEIKASPFIPKKWHCFRVGGQVNETICALCHDQTHPTALNFINNATGRGIDWENEPCLYECGVNSETDQMSIKDSAGPLNHWVALIGSTPEKK